MKAKTIEIISCYLDIIIIFSPFLLLFADGVGLYVASFYFIYLPYLIFNVYKYNVNKRNRRILDDEFKKIEEKDLVIN
jgi:hypothetical protein